MRILLTLLACLALSGCGRLIYKIDVQQGNFVTEDVIARVKTGMTKAEVRQILGTPLIADIFHANRWDYYFSAEKNGRAGDRTLLSVFFENDRVVSVKGEGRPAARPPVGDSTPPAAAPGAAPAAPVTAPPPAPGK